MAYTKTTWQDRDVITATKLNNLEAGVETADKAVAGCAKKSTKISAEKATDTASTDVVNVEEFKKLVALANEIATKVDAMNGV